MEEDMKKLEKFTNNCKECKFATCEQCEISWTEVQAIKNLINRNKELEGHYQHEQEYMNGEVFSAKQMYYIEDNYIDKSKVREKIEEIKDTSYYKEGDAITVEQVEILEELLQEE